MSALMIATFTVKDPDKFAEYAAKAKPTWSSLGAEALYRGRAQKVLTGGETDHEVVVGLQVPLSRDDRGVVRFGRLRAA